MYFQPASQWFSGKETISQCRRCRRRGFDPWTGRILQRRKGGPTPVFLPGEFHGPMSLGAAVHRSKSQARLSTHCNVLYIASTHAAYSEQLLIIVILICFFIWATTLNYIFTNVWIFTCYLNISTNTTLYFSSGKKKYLRYECLVAHNIIFSHIIIFIAKYLISILW